MVNLTNSFLYALLATAASAQLKHDRRHHEHRRRKEPCSDSSAGASATVPYPIGNSTTPAVGSTGGSGVTSTSLTTTVSATTTLLSTVTVVPVPISTGAGASPSGGAPGGAPSGGSPSGASPSGGAPSGGAPGSGGASSAAATGLGGSGGAPSACGLATTVTVTAQNTVTVTAGTGGAPSGASSGASSAATASSPAPAPASPAPASSPVASPPAASPPAASPPAASPSSSSAAAVASAAPAPAKPVHASSAAPSASPSPAQSPSSTSASAAASSPASAPSGGKCGQAYTGSGQVGSGTFNSGNTPWAYNWYFTSGGLPEGIEYVPSLQKPEWTQSLSSALPQATGTKYVKSINEPDQPTGTGGSQMYPSDAVALYSGTLDALAGQYKIGAPAVTSDNTTSGPYGPSGIVWLQQFKEACGDSNCKISFVDLHWYGDSASGDAQSQATAFLAYVDQAIKDVEFLYGSGVEVWFTEVSAWPLLNSGDSSAASVNSAFIQAIAPGLAQRNVARWAYYMAPLLESSGLAQTLLDAVSG